MPDYGFGKTLPVSYSEAIDLVTAALKEEGFGVLTEIDVKSTLKKKLDVDFRPYIILGACNPNLAHQALQAEPNLGLLLPCNVIVYDNEDGTSSVNIVDPMQMMGFVQNAALDNVASEANARLRRVLAGLEAPTPA